MQLDKFRDKVRDYRRAVERSQDALAQAVGLHPTVLSDKLNGKSKAAFSKLQIKKLIEVLAQWEAINKRSEAVELLELLDLDAASFTPEEWRTPSLARLVADLQPGNREIFSTRTVTFLFVKPEDNNENWEKQPDAMKHNILQYFKLVRQISSEYKGEIFQSQAESQGIIFNTAQQALTAALAIQRLCRAEKWDARTGQLKVKIALHSGTISERDGDIFGRPINRAAEILALPYQGGVIVLSLATAVLVREELPSGAELRDLGKFRLKNIGHQENLFQLVTPDLPENFSLKSTQARIFISYRDNIEPDQTIALQIYQALSQEHQVFIDRATDTGTVWAARIYHELKQADFFIPLLSEQSIQSEMLIEETAKATDYYRRAGHPVILPVRVAYREALQYPLSFYLGSYNWLAWESQADTARLIKDLREGIVRGGLGLPVATETITPAPADSANSLRVVSPPPRAPLELPEGTIDIQSALYVEREADTVALAAIQRAGVTITIKGPRQMGKSSLLLRLRQTAQTIGKRVVFLDFQLFDKASLQDADTFYRQFCSWLTDQLDIEDKVDDYWKNSISRNQRCTRYIQRYLLKAVGQPLALMMDEVETLFDTDFRSDFFGMLRSWHNSRAEPDSPWKRLDLVLVTSTEPYQLIDNLNQSPFNVGEVLDLQDFSPEQVAELNQKHGSPLMAEQEQALIALLSGHPYLTRRALYLIVAQRLSIEELFASATDDRGPFGDHLRYHLFRMSNKSELVQGFLEVLNTNSCPDEQIFFRLRGAGLVKHAGRAVVPRCKLYADYFGSKWDRGN